LKNWQDVDKERSKQPNWEYFQPPAKVAIFAKTSLETTLLFGTPKNKGICTFQQKPSSHSPN
jgi:hypothetical protein